MLSNLPVIGVGFAERQGAHVAGLQGQEHQRSQSQQDKQANPDVDRFTVHNYFLTLVIRSGNAAGFKCGSAYLLNISAVSTKSRPHTISEAITTVRVVARETSSGVGSAW